MPSWFSYFLSWRTWLLVLCRPLLSPLFLSRSPTSPLGDWVQSVGPFQFGPFHMHMTVLALLPTIKLSPQPYLEAAMSAFFIHLWIPKDKILSTPPLRHFEPVLETGEFVLGPMLSWSGSGWPRQNIFPLICHLEFYPTLLIQPACGLIEENIPLFKCVCIVSSRHTVDCIPSEWQVAVFWQVYAIINSPQSETRSMCIATESCLMSLCMYVSLGHPCVLTTVAPLSVTTG